MYEGGWQYAKYLLYKLFVQGRVTSTHAASIHTGSSLHMIHIPFLIPTQTIQSALVPCGWWPLPSGQKCVIFYNDRPLCIDLWWPFALTGQVDPSHASRMPPVAYQSHRLWTHSFRFFPFNVSPGCITYSDLPTQLNVALWKCILWDWLTVGCNKFL